MTDSSLPEPNPAEPDPAEPDQAKPDPASRPAPAHAFDRDEADAIVAKAAAAYFQGCRDRIEPFVEENFSVAGSARLHRHALGWDLLKAPANVALSVPQILLRLGSGAARRLGGRAAAKTLDRDIFLETAVARELRWRLMTGLLRLPYADGDRVSTVDGLAEAIVAQPEVQTLLVDAGRAAAARADDPGFRERLEASLAGYTGTRAAAAEITTGLIALGTGAVAFQKATPGALALGPVLAGTLAQSSAIASFPLGTAAGGLWYGIFPAQASAGLVAAATAGVMGVAAVATAFAGMISDPVQRAMGLHRRRLLRLIDGLETDFRADDPTGFVAYDLYVARLMDLGDLLIGLSRTLRTS